MKSSSSVTSLKSSSVVTSSATPKESSSKTGSSKSTAAPKESSSKKCSSTSTAAAKESSSKKGSSTSTAAAKRSSQRSSSQPNLRSTSTTTAKGSSQSGSALKKSGSKEIGKIKIYIRKQYPRLARDFKQHCIQMFQLQRVQVLHHCHQKNLQRHPRRILILKTRLLPSLGSFLVTWTSLRC